MAENKLRYGRLLILILFLMIPIVNAETEFLGTFIINEDINLIQTCSNCTFVNITTITTPDSSIIVSNTAMTKNGYSYNYTLAAQSQAGTYNVCGVGDLDGVNTIWCYTFDVTYTGKEKENNMIMIFLVYVFTGVLYFLLGSLNKRTIKKDSTKVSTWLMLLSYTMIIIKAIALSYYTYLQYIGADIGSLLYLVFFIDLFVLGIFSLLTLIIAAVAYLHPTDSKWEPEKWG